MGIEYGYGYGYRKYGYLKAAGYSTIQWILTPLGIPFPNVDYIWFDVNPPGVWDDTFYWTENL